MRVDDTFDLDDIRYTRVCVIAFLVQWLASLQSLYSNSRHCSCYAFASLRLLLKDQVRCCASSMPSTTAIVVRRLASLQSLCIIRSTCHEFPRLPELVCASWEGGRPHVRDVSITEALTCGTGKAPASLQSRCVIMTPALIDSSTRPSVGPLGSQEAMRVIVLLLLKSSPSLLHFSRVSVSWRRRSAYSIS